MKSQDYPVRHFDEMSRLTTSLKVLPAQVLDHSYSYESFGSWTLIIRYKGRPLQLAYDGHDRAYSLHRSASTKPPYSWALVWRGFASAVTGPCDEQIIDAIRSANTAG